MGPVDIDGDPQGTITRSPGIPWGFQGYPMAPPGCLWRTKIHDFLTFDHFEILGMLPCGPFSWASVGHFPLDLVGPPSLGPLVVPPLGHSLGASLGPSLGHYRPCWALPLGPCLGPSLGPLFGRSLGPLFGASHGPLCGPLLGTSLGPLFDISPWALAGLIPWALPLCISWALPLGLFGLFS